MDGEDGVLGRALHQAPETDGQVRLLGDWAEGSEPQPGQLVLAKAVASEGVDLVAERLPGGEASL